MSGSWKAVSQGDEPRRKPIQREVRPTLDLTVGGAKIELECRDNVRSTPSKKFTAKAPRNCALWRSKLISKELLDMVNETEVEGCRGQVQLINGCSVLTRDVHEAVDKLRACGETAAHRNICPSTQQKSVS